MIPGELCVNPIEMKVIDRNNNISKSERFEKSNCRLMSAETEQVGIYKIFTHTFGADLIDKSEQREGYR